MPCRTCGSTMQSVGSERVDNYGTPDTRFFWCGRCGTLKMIAGRDQFETIEAPALVERCRKLWAGPVSPADRQLWHSLGMVESIYPEAARVADPEYTPSLGEALRNPEAFAEGFTETSEIHHELPAHLRPKKPEASE